MKKFKFKIATNLIFQNYLHIFSSSPPLHCFSTGCNKRMGAKRWMGGGQMHRPDESLYWTEKNIDIC